MTVSDVELKRAMEAAVAMRRGVFARGDDAEARQVIVACTAAGLAVRVTWEPTSQGMAHIIYFWPQGEQEGEAHP